MVTTALLPCASSSLVAEAEAYVSRAVLMIRRARALVMQERRGSAALLTARRYELVRLLGDYQHFKHGRIFNPLIESGSEMERALASELKCNCILMGHAFDAYHARWSIWEEDEWPAYRRDMLATVDALIEHLETELAAIWRLSGAPSR